MLFYFIYFLFAPVFSLIIYISKFLNKKIQHHSTHETQTIKNVLKKLSYINRNQTKILLFHAASAGEFEQLKPILKKIDRNKYFLIQSFTSPTIFTKEFNNNLFDVCCYQPYDLFWKSYYYFSKIKPHAYIVTRHDIWPSHLYFARKLGIKIFYINANLHLNSIWIKKYISWVSKSIFKNLHFCLVPSENIKNLFLNILHKDKIHVIGDSRFDQIIERKNKNQDQIFLPNHFNNSFNIIFGSYDQNDENVIMKSLTDYYPKGEATLKKYNHSIILVPHEIDNRMYQMYNKLNNAKFNPQFFSALNFKDKQLSNVIIVDKVGILADLYKYTHLAYIGSGFSDGVHSVIEPGVYGNVVSFGPNIELLDEAKYIYKNDLGCMIKCQQDMINFFDLHKDSVLMKNYSQGIVDYIFKQKNVSQKIIKFIGENI